MPAPNRKILVRQWGTRGVNVDLNPLELDDSDLVQAQNAIADAGAGQSSIRKRPGLVAFSVGTTAGTVLGGIDLPLRDLYNGRRFIYIGRGPIL